MLKKKRQKGAALLLMILGVIISSLVVFTLIISPKSIESKKAEKTRWALIKAKQALLGYSVTDRGANPRPGELPCPDFDGDGQLNIAGVDYLGSACRTLVGWFPWVTMELEQTTDAENEQLWYVVSENFYNRSGVGGEPVLNSETAGQLFVDGSPTPLAAIIIAPGEAISGQVRSINDTAIEVAQYLENENSDGDEDYISNLGLNFNDRLITIRVDEIMELAEWRALIGAKQVLDIYYTANGFYPFAELSDKECDINSSSNGFRSGFLPMSSAVVPNQCPYPDLANSFPLWFTENRWDDLILFMVAPACAGSGTNNCNGFGFITYNNDANIRALVASSGRPLPDTDCFVQPNYEQNARPTNNVCDYLDSAENTNFDDIYFSAPRSVANNDVFVVVQ